MSFQKVLPLAIGILFVLSTSLYAKEIAIIVSKNHPLTQITQADLADIYLGQKELVGNVRLKPIDQSETQEIHETFLRKVLHMTQEAYVNHWNHRLFREGGIPPVLKNDGQDVIRSVKEKEGAVGYVWASEAKGVEGIRILLTFEP